MCIFCDRTYPHGSSQGQGPDGDVVLCEGDPGYEYCYEESMASNRRDWPTCRRLTNKINKAIQAALRQGWVKCPVWPGSGQMRLVYKPPA